ncbi:outer membrane beta-barrel protein [Massilia violaceinigra]|uniref:Outer membrane beta-barrel protein n=1 Tax=Massilia violaceinigra TaxID=2045208 RepID=A0ABY4A6X9_9BURK|nr:outer membrane beta-barrel protein [Massilia violaceinigra]UOD30433.1 outer membrane beta-barrel protein [Massilia violaceinigra]
MKKIAFVIAAAIASLSSAQAQTQASAANPLRFVVGAGLTAGGDKLATAEYSNGGSIDVRAGGMLAFLAGVDYRVNQQFSFQGTVGFHVDQASAKNGDVTFKRFPIEVLAYFHPSDKMRVGGGVRYASSPKLNGDGFGAGVYQEFDNTVGAVIEGEYFFSPNVGLKLRYVKEEYESSYVYRRQTFTEKTKGDHVGIFGNFYF